MRIAFAVFGPKDGCAEPIDVSEEGVGDAELLFDFLESAPISELAVDHH
jgi:hypothetical protein